MSSQSTVSVCNIALLSIGARAQISNFQENSTESDACNTLFQFIFEMIARAANWNCFRAQTSLSLIAAAAGTPENPDGTTALPPQPWLYSYLLPSDCLRAQFILPTNNTTLTGTIPITTASVVATTVLQTEQVPFKVAYSKDANNNPIPIILTNQTQAQLIYTINQPNPQIWDSGFTAAFVSSLAAWLVPALALNMALMEAQVKNATNLVMAARVDDANEGSTAQDHIPDWIRARNGSGAITNDSAFNGFGNLSWPG